MNEASPTDKQRAPWPIKYIIILLAITILGLTHWEGIFSIEIRAKLLLLLTGDAVGFGGLGVLICIVLLHIMRHYEQFSGVCMLLLPLLLFPIALLIIAGWVFPASEWRDNYVYRNGNDYLIIQRLEGFVTSDITLQRLERTASANSIVRILEEQYVLQENDDRFGGDQVIYKGKRWYKQPVK